MCRHKLAEIMGRIAYHTFAIQLPDYQKVLELDKELIAWRDSLPAFFHMTKPDLSHDKTHSYLFVQRHLLACEWYYTRITLNRYVTPPMAWSGVMVADLIVLIYCEESLKTRVMLIRKTLRSRVPLRTC